MAVLIKIRFEFTLLIEPQNDVKIEFIWIQAGGELLRGGGGGITGCIFLFTGMWAYNWGGRAYKWGEKGGLYAVVNGILIYSFCASGLLYCQCTSVYWRNISLHNFLPFCQFLSQLLCRIFKHWQLYRVYNYPLPPQQTPNTTFQQC